MVQRGLTLSLLAGLLLAIPAAADDKKKTETPDNVAEAMRMAGTPGEMHKKLEPLVGKWDVVMKMWQGPNQPPSESKATAETKWVMGGRFIRTAVTADFGGMKFEGVGVTGYDNLRKTYVGAWIDSMGTGITHSTGKVDDSGKIFTNTFEEIDPLTKQRTKKKEILKIIDADNYEQTFFNVVGERETKEMEITAKRAK
ncbi:MAG: DUF1579 domain-containing protein [Gemmataceae bacterium]